MKNFIMNDSGATMVEYGLIVAVIALVAVIGATLVGTGLKSLFSGINTTLTTPGG